MDETLGDYLDDWMETQRVRLAASSWHSYRGMIDRYLVPNLGELPLGTLTTRQLESFYVRLLRGGGRGGKPLSLRTVRYAHAVLRKALADAVRHGLVLTNAADGAALPRLDPDADEPDDELRAWSAQQLRCFLELSAAHPLADVWLVAATTGMRRGEVLGLRWVDVDLDAAVLHVRRALSQLPDRIQLKKPKTARARRLRIDERAVAALRRRRDEQQEQRTRATDWQDRWGLVFTDPDGRPLDPLEVTFAFRRLVASLPLPRIRLHDLRHTHATLLLQAGVPVNVVSERLGHANASMTLDVYSHVLPAMDDAAVERFSEQVFGDE